MTLKNVNAYVIDNYVIKTIFGTKVNVCVHVLNRNVKIQLKLGHGNNASVFLANKENVQLTRYKIY